MIHGSIWHVITKNFFLIDSKEEKHCRFRLSSCFNSQREPKILKSPKCPPLPLDFHLLHHKLHTGYLPPCPHTTPSPRGTTPSLTLTSIASVDVVVAASLVGLGLCWWETHYLYLSLSHKHREREREREREFAILVARLRWWVHQSQLHHRLHRRQAPRHPLTKLRCRHQDWTCSCKGSVCEPRSNSGSLDEEEWLGLAKFWLLLWVDLKILYLVRSRRAYGGRRRSWFVLGFVGYAFAVGVLTWMVCNLLSFGSTFWN